jgi:hypothetical protein
MMDEEAMSRFLLVDRYVGTSMDVDFSALLPGHVEVVESSRRLRREQSYGFIHAMRWIWLADGRSAASVPPGAGSMVSEILENVHEQNRILDSDLAGQLRGPIDDALHSAGLKKTDRMLWALIFACNASLLCRHGHGDCRRLTDESIPPAEGLRLPDHCFPDGIVYGVVVDARVVSIAFAHRSGIMEDQVVDVGVETAPAYRRRGYAKTVVSAVVEHIAQVGGEARYACSPENHVSAATARSAGFVPYGVGLALCAPRLDQAM